MIEQKSNESIQVEEVSSIETEDEKTKIDNHLVLEKWYQRTMAESPKLLPIAYLCMIGIGMVFNYYKYTHFGINIFQYASVFDFLIAPFEDYIILFFTFFSLLFCAFVFFTDFWLERKFPKAYNLMAFNLNKKKKYPAFRTGLFAFLIFAYIWLAAIWYGIYAHGKVLEQQDIQVVYYNNETTSGKQIGKTADVLFLVDQGGTTKVIPINSLVKEIRYTNN